ncbi:XylR family transcriptional regulator [Alteromonas oceanisediminis]|uniref:XylR family transcriptional regulator n=1 Tax=Alteromonas oceanisediminis TaxID=2836180 RepID=UPI001BD9790B|nr:DNA-binding transcriptional regulator [Alteromonas oceanisediminis]MBT0587823.1 DNA-binding transcriptional regulator [Alteromonas oceanisediminis]
MQQRRIGLLFNANKIYDRHVIEGIGHYLQSTQVCWDVFLEEDCLARLKELHQWEVDGIIADFDDPEIENALLGKQIPVVAVGSSYHDESLYPNVPYVATDNNAIVALALAHLREKGLERFAFYGLPHDNRHRWARERERAMISQCRDAGFSLSVFRGDVTRATTWEVSMQRLAGWINELPVPVGILAVTDARARHILQACERTNRAVPDQVSLIGIDDDDIARNLSKVSLSSINQGCFEMGFSAARLLHLCLTSPVSRLPPRLLIAPTGVVQRQSTDFKSLNDPLVIQAMHYIRQRASHGIKVEQVAQHLAVSRSQLETRFKQEVGMSVHQQLHLCKREEACRLLKDTDFSLDDIAKRSGYPSQQYMHAVLKEHYGKTVSQLRLQFKNAD